jgi:hypothetical protein
MSLAAEASHGASFGGFASSGALLQSAATVAAVLVGWLLSVLTERRSWKRRKLEQVRDRQLSSVLDALGLIGDLVSLGEELADAARALEAVGGGVADSETSRLLRSPRAEAVESIAARMDGCVVHLESYILGLRFFGFPEEAVGRMERCAQTGRSLVNAVRKSVMSEPVEELIDQNVSLLANELRVLVESGPVLLRR